MNRTIHRYAMAVMLSFLVAAAGFSQGTATAKTRKTFATPQAAADALIAAAAKFDVPALEAIFGPGGKEIINTGEPARDK